MVSGNFTLNLWFTFRAQVIVFLPSTSKYNLGISIGFQELTFQKRFDKSTAQRFWTAIVRPMWQQKRSKRTTSNSIVFEPNLSHFSSLKSLHKKHAFRTFCGLSVGGRSMFYKRLCTRVSLQNAVHDKSHPKTRTSRIESALWHCGRKELWAWIRWTWVKLDYWTKRAEQEPSRMGYV